MEFCNDCIKKMVSNYTAATGNRYTEEQMTIEPYSEIFGLSDTPKLGTYSETVFYFGDFLFAYMEGLSIHLSPRSIKIADGTNQQFQNILFTHLTGDIFSALFVGKKITLNSRT